MKDKPIKFLFIENNPDDARLISEILKEAGQGKLHLEWEGLLS